MCWDSDVFNKLCKSIGIQTELDLCSNMDTHRESDPKYTDSQTQTKKSDFNVQEGSHRNSMLHSHLRLLSKNH